MARVCHCCLWEPSWWPQSLVWAFRLTGTSISGLDEAEDTVVNSLRVRGVFLVRGRAPQSGQQVWGLAAGQEAEPPCAESGLCVPSAAGSFGIGFTAALCAVTPEFL